MQLRSGTVIAPVDRFLKVLNQDNNKWPTIDQAAKLSTKSRSWPEFEKHVKWLITYSTPATNKLKVNRLIVMATALTIMNSDRELYKVKGFNVLVDSVMRKLEGVIEKDKIFEFNIYDFIKEFKETTNSV
jgi:hypothetical protein